MAAQQPAKRDADEFADESAWALIRATFMEDAGLTECDRELSKEEIKEFSRLPKTLMRSMDLLLTSHRPLASFSVARYVVEQPEVLKPAFLRALHLTAYAVAESGGVPENAKDIIEKLREKADAIKGDAMQPLLRSLFDSMSDAPLRTDADGAVPAMGAVARDLFAIQACAALRRRDIDGYRALAANNWKPIHADRALYETASRVAREDAKAARLILDEYLGAFSRRGQPLTEGDFEQFTKPFLGLRPEWRLEPPAKPFEDKCSSCGETLKPAQPMPQQEFESLKREIENVIFKEVVSRRGGSPRELEALRKHAEIERQNRLNNPNVTAIVIDFLNVFHAQRTFNEPLFWKLVARLKNDFTRVYTVGRPWGIYGDNVFRQRLKDQDVGYFYCGRHSKDDLFSMCLAMWLGADTKLLTNDRFGDHRNTLPGPVHRPFDAWYRQNVIGFSVADFRYSLPPSFSRAVESSSSGYHVWTATEREDNSQLPEYKLYCLQLDQPS